MYSYGEESMNILYRTYRIGYDWAPLAKHAEEMAVFPPDNNSFYLPNARGEYPHTRL